MWLGVISEAPREEVAGIPVLGGFSHLKAVLNGDDPRVMGQAARTRARIVRFGLGPGTDVRAEDVAWREGAFEFSLYAPEGRTPARVAGLGETPVDSDRVVAVPRKQAERGID